MTNFAEITSKMAERQPFLRKSFPQIFFDLENIHSYISQ